MCPAKACNLDTNGPTVISSCSVSDKMLFADANNGMKIGPKLTG